jgi:hypothetical protein
MFGCLPCLAPSGPVRWLVLLVIVLSANVQSQAAYSLGTITKTPVSQNLKDSLLEFGGRLSTTGIYPTIIFNQNMDSCDQAYDNSIIGVAYRRDLVSFDNRFFLGVEIGLADRYGRDLVCCDNPVRSSVYVHTGELWAGPSLRYESIPLFYGIQVSPSVVGGLSATTNSIGREREREITLNGNARLLFYLALELAFSTPGSTFEIVLRLHHRSGANGTLGRLMEGYNANILGVRLKF